VLVDIGKYHAPVQMNEAAAAAAAPPAAEAAAAAVKPMDGHVRVRKRLDSFR
jgi:hypothetical protein